MNMLWVGILQAAIAAILFFWAFRNHERYWTLGFLGWRKVYAGLALFLLSAFLTIVANWPTALPGGLASLSHGITFFSAIDAALGLALVLAGSIERLRDLAEERHRLEEVRAGFDLFDTLRDVVGGPYAFLEVLDFALKEMVRAAGVATGGLWLHSPAGNEWVLTGAANMSQTFRRQVESVKGSGTGFDRLARLHKAHLFSRPDEIRLFFPEWEAAEYRSILGLPLVTGSVGSAERRVLGVIVLADPSSDCFDDDRARRLHAAADYIAAVVAEGRLHRQLEAAQKQIETQRLEAERERQETEQEKESIRSRSEGERRAAEDDRRALIGVYEERLGALRTQTQEERGKSEVEYQSRLAAEAARYEMLQSQLQQALDAQARLQESLDSERRQSILQAQEWQHRLESAQAVFERERGERDAAMGQLRDDLLRHEDSMRDTVRRHDEAVHSLSSQLEETHRAAADEQRRLREELRSSQLERADFERQVAAERDEERRRADEEVTRYQVLLDAERDRMRRTAEEHQSVLQVMEGQASARAQEAATAQAMLNDTLAALMAGDPSRELLEAMRRQLPDTSLWCVWKHQPGGAPELLALYDRYGWRERGSFPQLAPWDFELESQRLGEAIRLTDRAEWAAMEEECSEPQRLLWDDYWGSGVRPSWAIAWAWGSDSAAEKGWVSVFGFGDHPVPSQEEIERLGLLAQMVGVSLRKPQTPAPEVLSEGALPSPVEDSDDTLSESAAASPVDLHAAILSWVGQQERDEWHLDLGARQLPMVDGSRLHEVLESARDHCRLGHDAGVRLSIQTLSLDDAVILRVCDLDPDQNPMPQTVASDERSLSVEGLADQPITSSWWLDGQGRKGMEIRFETEARQPVRTETSSPEPSHTAASLKILIADDDPSFGELLSGLLGAMDHAAEVAFTAQDAYQTFVRGGFDVVVISADLPQQTGLALAEWVKSHRCDTPVILVTGSAPDEILSQPSHWDRVLEKPFSLDRLQECLESLALGHEAPAANPVEPVAG
ncbi:MAG: response regulator [candidate division Zixibacteria bacterium]|nr:response regulator [candidate division Zixibacteria bacterium]